MFSLSQGYDSPVQLSPPALEELIWWRNNLEAWNGKSLASGTPDLIIETDASRKGWGAYCMGVSTEGQWAEGESQLHINCLELLAGAFAIKTFAKGKVQMKVCLLMDNMTAAHYINKMGGGGGVCKISHSSSTGSRLMELVPSTPGPYRGTTHPRNFECASGQRIQSHVRSPQLEIRSPNPCRVKSSVGATRGRSVCIAPHCSAAMFLWLATRPCSRGRQCFLSNLGGGERVCLPPLMP